ncbi:MAG: HEPN domain-containing protein, partial [Stellaceae bacterium]
MEVSKDDLEALSDARIREAMQLYRNQFYSGAYYLAGYAVELAIKACIAKHIRSGFIPDRSFINRIYQHKLDD